MPLIVCPECGHEKVSTHADKCVACGMPVEKMFTLANIGDGKSGSESNPMYAKACNLAQQLCAAGVNEAALKTGVQQIRQLISQVPFAEQMQSAAQSSVLVLADRAVETLREMERELCVGIKELHILGDYKVGALLTQYLHAFLNLEVLDIALSDFELDYNVQKLPSIGTLGLRFCPKLEGGCLQKYLRDEFAAVTRLFLDGNRQISPELFLLILNQYGERVVQLSIAGCSVSRDVEYVMTALTETRGLDIAVTNRFA